MVTPHRRGVITTYVWLPKVLKTRLRNSLARRSERKLTGNTDGDKQAIVRRFYAASHCRLIEFITLIDPFNWAASSRHGRPEPSQEIPAQTCLSDSSIPLWVDEFWVGGGGI